MPSPTKFFSAAGTNGRLDLIFSWRASEDQLKDHTEYDQGPEIHGKPRRLSLLVDKAQQDGCMKVWESGLLEWNASIQ